MRRGRNWLNVKRRNETHVCDERTTSRHLRFGFGCTMNLVQNDRMKPSLCEITSRMKQHYLYDSTTLMCYRSQHRPG